MEQNSATTLDLSKKTPNEIAEFLHALLSARQFLARKGYRVKITRRRVKPALKLPR